MIRQLAIDHLTIEIGVVQENGQPIGRIGASVLVPEALFDEMSFTHIVPMAALGGDDSFNFGMVVQADYRGPTDCAPNGGTLSPTGLRDSDGDGCQHDID